MSRSPVPKYRKHPNGSAFVQHRSIPNASHRLHLGKYGSAKSLERYQQFLHRIAAGGDPLPTNPLGTFATIDDLIDRYMTHAENYYRRDNGLSPEFDLMLYALKPLHQLFGDQYASEFGPRALVTVRTHLAQLGLARTNVNKLLPRIKRFFRWCCEQELCDPALYHRLLCVKGLARGQDGCRESEPVQPASANALFGVLPYLSPVVAAMAEIQYRCGMRPGEVCIMRACDIDMTGKVWLYRPQRHKTEWRGFSQVKAIPLAAQKLLRPFLGNEPYCFPPAHARAPSSYPPRKTPLYPSVLRRQAELKRQRARRKQRVTLWDRYNADTYRRAIDYGFRKAEKAGVHLERFSPNQLRHAILTYVSEKLGYQAAQRWAGHEDINTTGIYVKSQISELVMVANQLEDTWRACG